MLHVEWHNMKLHDCISYAQSHRVESGVCQWYWSFTILDECLVSSEMGQRPKSRLTVCKIIIIIINHVCLGEARWGM